VERVGRLWGGQGNAGSRPVAAHTALPRVFALGPGAGPGGAKSQRGAGFRCDTVFDYEVYLAQRLGTVLAAAETQRAARGVPHNSDSQHDSGRWRGVWRKQLAQGAVEPPAELFEHVQPDILLAHFDAMEGGFRNPQLPGKIPVRHISASPSNFPC
jgi:hypothetical protein